MMPARKMRTGMSEKITVSIITASYNGGSTIRGTIESVLHQTHPCKEYIVMDGGSTDDTLAILEEYRQPFAEKGIDYVVVSEPDHGIYDAMNKGIDRATGTIIGLINTDDWYEPEAVETVIKTYENTRFEMMYADLRMIDHEQVRGIKKARLREGYITTRDWNHPTTFLTREMYRHYRYPCHNVYDDLDLLLKIRKDHRHVEIVNKVLANYRLGGVSNKRSWKNTMYRAKIKYQIYRNNGYSRLYWLEAYGMEIGKYVLTK
jgi:glycosyltransferase involved in cell wall biosynthesis